MMDNQYKFQIYPKNKQIPSLQKLVGQTISGFSAEKSVAVKKNAVKLPTLGWVKANIPTTIYGDICLAKVSMSRSGKFFVRLCCTETPIPKALLQALSYELTIQ